MEEELCAQFQYYIILCWSVSSIGIAFVIE